MFVPGGFGGLRTFSFPVPQCSLPLLIDLCSGPCSFSGELRAWTCAVAVWDPPLPEHAQRGSLSVVFTRAGLWVNLQFCLDDSGSAELFAGPEAEA